MMSRLWRGKWIFGTRVSQFCSSQLPAVEEVPFQKKRSSQKERNLLGSGFPFHRRAVRRRGCFSGVSFQISAYAAHAARTVTTQFPKQTFSRLGSSRCVCVVRTPRPSSGILSGVSHARGEGNAMFGFSDFLISIDRNPQGDLF